jgi:LytR cell envelope-related transcriptional attenuator
VRGEPADAGLVRRQQRVLAGVLGRALSPGALLHPGRVGRLLPGLGTAAVSDGTSVDDLLALSRTLARGDTAIRAAPTEAQTDGGTPVLHEDEAGALFAAVRTDRPLPDPAPGAQTPAPDDATLDVLNATGRDGLGAEIAGTLGDLGFRTAEPTTASRPAQDTVIRFSPDRAGQAQLLAATVPVASTVPDPGTSGVLQLVLGRSFDGTVRAAAEPGPTPGGEVTAAPTTCG